MLSYLAFVLWYVALVFSIGGGESGRSPLLKICNPTDDDLSGFLNPYLLRFPGLTSRWPALPLSKEYRVPASERDEARV